jgi:exonuclease 3'-5' domain-containing protein 2
MHRSIRKKKIYGNYQVFSPDNVLMFRCDEKKANWYLDRDLAEKIDSCKIKLTFIPNGYGDDDFLKEERENICVVCGEKNIEVLTRHHLIPYEFRRHFPEAIKSRNSAYIVPVCGSCHDIYEGEYAYHYKKEIADEYNVKFKNQLNTKTHCAIKNIDAILKHRKDIPQKKLDEIQNNIINYLIEKDIFLEKEDLTDSKLIEVKSLFIVKPEHRKSFGELIVEKCDDIEEFTNNWVNHFIDNMSPKYMPEYFEKLL